MTAVTLAGCTGGGDVQGTGDEPSGPQFTEDTGAIRGTITDAELLPLEEAQVAILGLDGAHSTTTDDSGAFVLSNVAPGTHTVAVQKLGFTSQAKKVDVVAAEETFVEIMLEPIPVEEPYVESIPHAGQYGIGFAFVLSTICYGCNSEERAWFMFGGYPDDFAGMVVEARWETQDWLGFDLLAREAVCGEDGESSCIWYRTRSPSPLHYVVLPCEDYTGAPTYGATRMPCGEEEFERNRDTSGGSAARLETWYIGLFQEETHTADPVCTVLYAAGCYGVGPAPETRWDTWVNIFHVEVPDNAESYTAFPDQ